MDLAFRGFEIFSFNLIKHTFIKHSLSIRAELYMGKEKDGGGKRRFLSIRIYADAEPKQIISIT